MDHGKVAYQRLTTATVGMSLGLLLAGPLYLLVSVPIGIGLCAALMLVTGPLGLIRFGDLPRAPREPAPLVAAITPRDSD
jgi:hypothetical protein